MIGFSSKFNLYKNKLNDKLLQHCNFLIPDFNKKYPFHFRKQFILFFFKQKIEKIYFFKSTGLFQIPSDDEIDFFIIKKFLFFERNIFKDIKF